MRIFGKKSLNDPSSEFFLEIMKKFSTRSHFDALKGRKEGGDDCGFTIDESFIGGDRDLY